MKTHLSLRSVLGLGLLASSFSLVACSSDVNGGGTGGGGGDDQTSSSISGDPPTTTGTGGAGGGTGGAGGAGGAGGGLPGGNALAMLYSEIPPYNGSGGGSSVGTTGPGGGGPDPDSVFLFIGSPAPQCENPYGYGEGCTTSYTVTVVLPPGYQTPGIYTLEELQASISVSEGGPDPELCSGGGGSYWDGTLEIISIDDTHVSGVFSGTDTSWGFDIDGPMEAPRCF